MYKPAGFILCRTKVCDRAVLGKILRKDAKAIDGF